jgi:hypothetical protein
MKSIHPNPDNRQPITEAPTNTWHLTAFKAMVNKTWSRATQFPAEHSGGLSMLNSIKTMILVSALIGQVGIALSQEVSLPSSVIAKQHKVPETVVYAIVFHQTVALKDRADDMDRRGGDGSVFRRHMMAKFGLTDRQLLELNSVAEDFRAEAKDPEDMLRASVERFRERNAQLPKGSRTLPPPSEAAKLLAARDAVILHARDRFHTMVGDEEFDRLDQAIKSRVAHDVLREDAPKAGVIHEN